MGFRPSSTEWAPAKTIASCFGVMLAPLRPPFWSAVLFKLIFFTCLTLFFAMCLVHLDLKVRLSQGSVNHVFRGMFRRLFWTRLAFLYHWRKKTRFSAQAWILSYKELARHGQICQRHWQPLLFPQCRQPFSAHLLQAQPQTRLLFPLLFQRSLDWRKISAGN